MHCSRTRLRLVARIGAVIVPLLVVLLAASSTSDGRERAVANAQYLVTTTPTPTITAESSPTPGSPESPDVLLATSTVTPSPTVAGPDLCYGDELMTYRPETPRVGNELLIAVSSAYHHPYPRLAGTERTTFVRERPGQLGTVWEWTVSPTWAGQHSYTFYVDATIPCKEISIRVQAQLGVSSSSSGDNDSGDNSGGTVILVVTATPVPATATLVPLTRTSTPTATATAATTGP